MNAPHQASPTDIILDIETMGVSPGCAIVALGAVLVGEARILDTFYQSIRMTEFNDKVDPDTLEFWLKQPDESRLALLHDQLDLQNSLMQFKGWLLQVCGSEQEIQKLLVWGNGADFDQPILKAAYDRCGYVWPFGRYNNRCLRTLMKEYPMVKRAKPSIKHHALHDAVTEADTLVAIREHKATCKYNN